MPLEELLILCYFWPKNIDIDDEFEFELSDSVR